MQEKAIASFKARKDLAFVAYKQGMSIVSTSNVDKRTQTMLSVSSKKLKSSPENTGELLNFLANEID